jgi:hypothetical protein
MIDNTVGSGLSIGLCSASVCLSVGSDTGFVASVTNLLGNENTVSFETNTKHSAINTDFTILPPIVLPLAQTGKTVPP